MMNLRTRTGREREHRMQERLRAVLSARFERSILAELRKVADDASTSPLDKEHVHAAIERHKLRLYRVLAPFYRGVMNIFGKRAIEAINAGRKSSDDQFQMAVDKYVHKWSARKVTDISTTTRKKIQSEIDAYFRPESDMSDRDLSRNILEHVGDDLPRAKTIARTETHSASQDAGFQAAQSLGIDLVKRWVAVIDGRTREDHAAADGQMQPMHEPFLVGDEELMFPGDPTGDASEVINCRCVQVYEEATASVLSAIGAQDSNSEGNDE